jgi:cell division protease FtsH
MFWSKPEEPPEEKQISFLTIIFYMYLFFVFTRMYKQYKEKSNFNKFDFIHRKKGKKEKKDKNKTKSETKSVENSLKKIIGLETVKEEIKYYMELINDKSKYEEWNVTLPKGILLAGPPGTGKTLLVKTMSEYLDIPVLSVSGSSFVEVYVGVGAARVRKLFSKARELEKCIIFIDEIDAVGSKRNIGNNSEKANTLNQLLVEMDGFDDTSNIMIFAATNLIKFLDPALLRSGRFDKKIFFDPPNFIERKEIFKLYMEDVKLPNNISHSVLSERTAGMTGADIANITNQAKMNAIQRKETDIKLTEKDIQIAIDEVMIGREKRERMMNKKERERVAHHEAGHALMGYLLKHTEPPIKVSIIPRGESALGFSQPKPSHNKLYTEDAILALICVLLGGRSAEKLIYNNVSTGASDDIEKISNFITLYNTNWGMSKEMGALNPSCMGLIGENMSENMFSKCKEMTDELEEFTFSTLKKYKKYVKSLARDLLKNETIVYARIKELLPNKLENSLIFKFDIVEKNLKE